MDNSNISELNKLFAKTLDEINEEMVTEEQENLGFLFNRLEKIGKLLNDAEERRSKQEQLAINFRQAELEDNKFEESVREFDKTCQKDDASDKKHFWMSVADWVIRILELGVPMVTYVYWLKKGFIFEEKGSINSITMKNLIGNVKPKKR